MQQNLLGVVVIAVASVEAVAAIEDEVATKVVTKVVVVVVVDDFMEVVEVDIEVVIVEEVLMVEGTTTKVQVVATAMVKEGEVMVAVKAGVVMVVAKEVVALMVSIIIKAVVDIILSHPRDNMVAVVMAQPNLLQVTTNPQVDKAMAVNHLQEVKVSNIVVLIANQLHQPAMALALMDSKHPLPLQVTIRAMAKVLEAMAVALRLLQEDIHRVPVMVAQQELVMEEPVEELPVMVNKTG